MLQISKFLPSALACRLAFARQRVGLNERAIEMAFVLRQVARFAPCRVLDVGSGRSPLPALLRLCGCVVWASDVAPVNRYFYVVRDDITASRLPGGFDLITCVSVLEHILDHRAAVANMLGRLRSGGVLVMTFPYTEGRYVADVYKLAGSEGQGRGISYVCQSFSRVELAGWCTSFGGEIVEQGYWRCWTGPTWSVGDRVSPPVAAEPGVAHQLSCVAIRKVVEGGA